MKLLPLAPLLVLLLLLSLLLMLRFFIFVFCEDLVDVDAGVLPLVDMLLDINAAVKSYWKVFVFVFMLFMFVFGVLLVCDIINGVLVLALVDIGAVVAVAFVFAGSAAVIAFVCMTEIVEVDVVVAASSCGPALGGDVIGRSATGGLVLDADETEAAAAAAATAACLFATRATAAAMVVAGGAKVGDVNMG